MGDARATGAVLITGGSSGVGRSLVHHLAPRFDVVMAAARRVETMEREFASYPNVTVLGVDLGDPEAVGAFADRVRQGVEVSYVINNAGVSEPGNVEDLTREAMERSLQVNVLAPFEIMQAVLPRMVEADFGRIVNVTSGAPLNCFAGYGAYSASKAALNALTITAAREHEHRDIKINLMSPGPVRSEMAPDAALDPSVCHPTLDHLLALPADGPTGSFFWLGYDLPLLPDLSDVDWLTGQTRGGRQRAF